MNEIFSILNAEYVESGKVLTGSTEISLKSSE
jgi:hypothetical protein